MSNFSRHNIRSSLSLGRANFRERIKCKIRASVTTAPGVRRTYECQTKKSTA